MGNLKGSKLTLKEQWILARRHATETGEKFINEVCRRTYDGIVEKVNSNGSYDVRVPGRAAPFAGIGSMLLGDRHRVDDGVVIGFLENNRYVPLIVATRMVGRHSKPDQSNPTIPPVPLAPKLWLQHEGFWWLPGHSRDTQASISVTPGSSLFIDHGLNQSALANALNFKGLVAFPDGSDQIIASLTPVYASAGASEELVDFNEEIEFVLPEDENPPTQQQAGRSFTLTYEPSPPLGPDVEPSYEHSPPSYFSPTVLYPIAPPRTYGLALQPAYSATLEYLGGPAEGLDYVDFFTGDGTVTDFHPYSPPGSYSTNLGVITAPSAWIHSLTDFPTVDGVPDTLATFFEGTVRLSYAPEPGTTVIIYSNYSTLTQQFETISGDGPEYPLSGLASGLKAYYTLAAYGNVDQADVTANVLLKDRAAVLLAIFAEDDTISFTYSHTVDGAERYTITAMRITEKNVTTNALRILDTPLAAPFLAHQKDLDGNVFQGADQGKLGQLFYDPVTSSYTIAGPTGLIWRDRVSDLGSAGGPHYTLANWPTEGASQDQLLASYPSVKRKLYPWYGVAAASKFALQCPWNRVGGAANYPGAGDASDTADYLRFYARSEENAWSNVASRLVTELAQSPAAGRLNIVGSCFTGINLGGGPLANDTAFPITRNLGAWIVTCGWNVTGYNGEMGNSSAAGQTPLGWKDAGLTFNAMDPATGETLAQLTLKCSPDDVHNIYQDPFALINQQIENGTAAIAAVIDKYVHNNPAYWPPASGSTPAQPIIGFASYGATSNFFEYPPESGDAFFMVGRLTGLAEAGAQVRQLPGFPAFNRSYSGSPGMSVSVANSAQNPAEQLQPKLMLDEDNNIYVYLHTPIWGLFTPQLSTENGGTTKFVTGSVNYHHAADGTPQPQPLYHIVSTGNLLIATGGDTPDGIVSSNFGLVYAPSFPLSFSNEFRSVAWFYPTTPAGESPPGTPVYTSPANDLHINWKSLTFNPAFATVTGTYTGLPRPIEYLTLSGWQEVPQNYAGFITYDFISDWTATYFTNERLYLYKIHYDENAKTFAQVWRKDVGDPAPELALINDAPRNAQPNSGFTVAKALAGRYIFDVRSSYKEVYTDIELKLFAWRNGDSEPGPPIVVSIPNSLRVNIGETSFYDIIADVNADGAEVVTVWHLPPEASIFDPHTLYLTILTFAAEGEPTVEQVAITAGAPPSFPNPTLNRMTKRMVRVNGSYYWDGNDGNIYAKPVT